MNSLKWGGSMNVYQEKYIALKKQFEQSKGDSGSVTALYDFKERLEECEEIEAKEVLVNVYDLLNYKKDAYDLLSSIGDLSDIKIKKRLGKMKEYTENWRNDFAIPKPKTEEDIQKEKEMLAEIAIQHGIEWEQKGTHEEHLDVYNFKKKERKKEVQELEQEKENLTAENEGLTSQIADARADIKLLEEEKIQFQKDKEIAEKRAEKAETELKKLEDRREFLQPVMDNVSKEIKEYGMIKTFLPEATALERAVTYRDKKIKPLFIEMKNKIGAMAAQVKELTRERDSWKSKFQKKKQEHEKTKKELAEVQKDYQKLSGEKEILQGIADRYNRLLRMLGKDMVERLVQDDIRMQAELEAKKQKEQMPKKIGDRIQWARERSEEHNAKIKKNKAKYRGMEL